MSQHFKQRMLLSSIVIFFLTLSIYYSFATLFKPIFILLNIGFISLALIEYYQLAQSKGLKPATAAGVGLSIFYLTSLSASLYDSALRGLPFLSLLFSLLILFLVFFRKQSSSLVNIAITLFGIGYLTLPLSFTLKINYFFSHPSLGEGRLWLAYVLLISKITDIGAYFSGKILGKTKLAPSISPQKTIEGSIGGAISALLTSFLFTFLSSSFLEFKMDLIQSLWIGLLISILAQLGDLTESLLKRDAGVKDSSHLPGLGGILDIADSLVFTLPLMYVLLDLNVVG